MLKLMTEFYLIAIALVFFITLFVGTNGAAYHEVLAVAALGWPLAGMYLLARGSYRRIKATAKRPGSQR